MYVGDRVGDKSNEREREKERGISWVYEKDGDM